LLGLSYYLSEPMFRVFIAAIGELIPVGSQLVFDYPDHNHEADTQTQKQTELATGANEAMLVSYKKEGYVPGGHVFRGRYKAILVQEIYTKADKIYT